MAIVQKWGHQIGDRIDSPAYVDANFLVYYAVGSHRASSLQIAARNVMGDLLAQGVTMLISLVTVEEAWWATLHELYCRHVWQSPFPHAQCYFSRAIAKQHFQEIMLHKHDLKKIVDGLQELRDKGADIRFIPEGERSFAVCQNVPDHMDKHNLLSADALHFSLALSEATTFITFDVGDFRSVLDPSKDLTIILLP